MEIRENLGTGFGELLTFNDAKEELKKVFFDNYGERLRAARGLKNVGEMAYHFTQDEDALRDKWYAEHDEHKKSGKKFSVHGQDYIIQTFQDWNYGNDPDLEALNKQIALVSATLKTYQTEATARRLMMRRNGLATKVGEPRYRTKCLGPSKNIVEEETVVIPLNQLSNPQV